MHYFSPENPWKFVYRASSAPPEGREGGAEAMPETGGEDMEEVNVLLEAKGENLFNHEKDTVANVMDLLNVVLDKNMRDWFRPPTADIINKHQHDWMSLLPTVGEEPDEEDHVYKLVLEAGQVRFINKEGNELLRIDISNVFRDREVLKIQHAVDRITAERIARRYREREMRTGRNYLQALYLATADLPGPRPKPGPPPAPPNPDETEAANHVLKGLEAGAENRSQILTDYESGMQQKAGLIEGFFGLRSDGYNLKVTLDPTIAEFNDDDWSAEGKWKDVAGREAVRKLLEEEPERAATVSYDAFLKAQEKGALSKVHPDIRKEIKKNFEKDWKFFDQKRNGVLAAEKDPRRQKELGFYWNQRESVVLVAQMLDQYKAAKEHSVYQVNPFRAHKWRIDEIRKVVQEDSNTKLSFDDVAEYLYEDNLEDVKKMFRDKKIPEELIKELKGDLKDDYAKFKKLEEETRKDAKKHTQVKLVLDILGDYIVYGIRLVGLVSKLKYDPAGRLRTAEAREREKNIFEASPTNDPMTVRGKVMLSRIFFDGVERPERYYILGQDIVNFFSGEDTDFPHGRTISMRDLNGQEYSLDGQWFTTYISGETAFIKAYEFATEYRDGKERIDQAKLQQKLNRYLQLGISVFRLRPGDSLHKIMERNAIERTIRRDDNILAVHDHFQKELKAYFDVFEQYQREHPSLTKDELDAFFENHKLSKDLLEFIRAGAVVDYHTGGEAGRKLAERPEFLRYRYQFKPEDADKIIADLEKTGKFKKDELAKIKENLTLGVVLAMKGDRVTFYGLGTSIALPHGHYLDIGFGKSRPDSLDFGVGVGKSFEVSEKLSVTLRAGVGVVSGYLAGGGAVIANYDFERTTLYALGAGTTEGFFVAGGFEYRQDVLRDEKIEAKLLDAHINGPDGLSRYDEAQRYSIVLKNPEKYPEFEEVIRSIEEFNFDEKSKPIIFNVFYDLYVDELTKQGTKEAAYSHRIPIFRFLDFRGAGIGAGIGLPSGMLNIFMPIKLGAGYRTLVFRLADVEAAENFSSRTTQEQLLAQYKNQKVVEREIRFKGHVVVDKEGRLTMSDADNAMFDIDPGRQFGTYQTKFEEDLDVQAHQPDENGLMKLNIRRNSGETRFAVDPDIKDKVTVVTDGDEVYLSCDKNQRVFVTRENLTYPFPNEGAVETTYLTITENPQISRRGPGSVEDRSPISLWKRRGMRWRIEENLNYRGEKGIPQIMEKTDYEKWMAEHPDLLKDRMSAAQSEDFRKAAEKLMKATSREVLPRFELPKNFEAVLAALKADEAFMEGFKKLATLGYDFKDIKVDERWTENLPKLIEYIKGWFAASAIPLNQMNDAAIDRALSDLIMESFTNIWHNKDDVDKAWRNHLRNFEQPMLYSIFDKYLAEQHPDWDAKKRNDKAYEIALTVTAQMADINFTGSPSFPIQAGTSFASLSGSRGITGIRRLYASDQVPREWGLIGNLPFDITSKNEVQATVSRFWIDYLSNLPDLHKDDSINELLKLTDGRQKIHEVLRQPLPLKLTRLTPTFMTTEEMSKLADVYTEPPPFISAENGNLEVVKKFLKFCQEVRDAQLAGKKEYPIPETNYVIVLKTEVKMGIFKKCGNGSATLVEEFHLKEKTTDHMITMTATDVYIPAKAGFTRRDFGIFATPAIVTPIPSFPKKAAAGAEPPQPGPQSRVLPR